jgi:hypothetical protein
MNSDATMTPLANIVCPVCAKMATLQGYSQLERRVPRDMPLDAEYECEGHEIRITVTIKPGAPK